MNAEIVRLTRKRDRLRIARSLQLWAWGWLALAALAGASYALFGLHGSGPLLALAIAIVHLVGARIVRAISEDGHDDSAGTEERS